MADSEIRLNKTPLSAQSWKAVGLIVVAAPAVLALALHLGWVMQPVTKLSQWRLFVLLIAAPLLEEYIFRGALQPAVQRGLCTLAAKRPRVGSALLVDGRFTWFAPSLVTSAVFVFAHWVFAQHFESLWVVFPSLALGYLQYATGRWWCCALMHAWFNAVWCFARF